MFCDLGEEERRIFRRQKEKKRKKLDAAKSLSRDERVSYDIQPCKIYFAVLKPFLNKTAFYTEFL